MIQSSRFPVSSAAAGVLMFGFMNSQDYRAHPYGLQLADMKSMKAAELRSVSVGNACILQFLLKVAWVYNKKERIMLTRGVGEREKVKKKKKGKEREEGETKRQDSRRGRRALPQLPTPVYLMMHWFRPAIPHCCRRLTSSLHSRLWNTQTQPVVIQFPCFLCLLFISWIPCEASKAAVSVSPLTVLCVCHSGLVKR